MALTAKKALAIANQYTDDTVIGGGAIKGKNCTIDSIEPISGGQRVTFKWTLDDGTEQTTTMDVMDGQDGKGIKSVAVNEESHLIITYTDDTTYDAGAIEVHSAVDSVNGKTGEVTLDASDVGALPDDTSIPSKTSDLTNDSNFVADASYVHTDNNYDATAKGIVDGVTTALAGKVDKVASATNGNFAGLDANGNLTDSGKKASDFVGTSDIYKSIKVNNTGAQGSTTKYIKIENAYPTGVVNALVYNISAGYGDSEILTLSTRDDNNRQIPVLNLITRTNISRLSELKYDTNGDIYIGIGAYTTATVTQIAGTTIANFSVSLINVGDLPSTVTDGIIINSVNKADKVTSATAGDLASLDANGNLADSGVSKDVIPSDASASNKLVTRAQSGAILPLVNLGTEYTAELKADISSGKFEKAVVGGYLTINGHVYYLAHPDYWLHTGDTECTTHHMLVIPAGNIGTGKMNNSNITTGGYAGSDFKTGNNSNTALATARAQIIADFGAANILTHRELFTTAVTDDKASNWAWADSDVDLMNEVMVYGCNVWGSHPGYETGIDKCQLKLFQERPDLITTRSAWWLRGVVSAADFAFVVNYGNADTYGAGTALGVRPAFAIIGD